MSARGGRHATACGDEAAPPARALSSRPGTAQPSLRRRSGYLRPSPSFFPYVRYPRPQGSVRCALHPARSEANDPDPRRRRRANPPGRMYQHAPGRRLQCQLGRPRGRSDRHDEAQPLRHRPRRPAHDAGLGDGGRRRRARGQQGSDRHRHHGKPQRRHEHRGAARGCVGLSPQAVLGDPPAHPHRTRRARDPRRARDARSPPSAASPIRATATR